MADTQALQGSAAAAGPAPQLPNANALAQFAQQRAALSAAPAAGPCGPMPAANQGMAAAHIAPCGSYQRPPQSGTMALGCAPWPPNPAMQRSFHVQQTAAGNGSAPSAVVGIISAQHLQQQQQQHSFQQQRALVAHSCKHLCATSVLAGPQSSIRAGSQQMQQQPSIAAGTAACSEAASVGAGPHQHQQSCMQNVVAARANTAATAAAAPTATAPVAATVDSTQQEQHNAAFMVGSFDAVNVADLGRAGKQSSNTAANQVPLPQAFNSLLPFFMQRLQEQQLQQQLIGQHAMWFKQQVAAVQSRQHFWPQPSSHPSQFYLPAGWIPQLQGAQQQQQQQQRQGTMEQESKKRRQDNGSASNSKRSRSRSLEPTQGKQQIAGAKPALKASGSDESSDDICWTNPEYCSASRVFSSVSLAAVSKPRSASKCRPRSVEKLQRLCAELFAEEEQQQLSLGLRVPCVALSELPLQLAQHQPEAVLQQQQQPQVKPQLPVTVEVQQLQQARGWQAQYPTQQRQQQQPAVLTEAHVQQQPAGAEQQSPVLHGGQVLLVEPILPHMQQGPAQQHDVLQDQVPRSGQRDVAGSAEPPEQQQQLQQQACSRKGGRVWLDGQNRWSVALTVGSKEVSVGSYPIQSVAQQALDLAVCAVFGEGQSIMQLDGSCYTDADVSAVRKQLAKTAAARMLMVEHGLQDKALPAANQQLQALPPTQAGAEQQQMAPMPPQAATVAEAEMGSEANAAVRGDQAPVAEAPGAVQQQDRLHQLHLHQPTQDAQQHQDDELHQQRQVEGCWLANQPQVAAAQSEERLHQQPPWRTAHDAEHWQQQPCHLPGQQQQDGFGTDGLLCDGQQQGRHMDAWGPWQPHPQQHPHRPHQGQHQKPDFAGAPDADAWACQQQYLKQQQVVQQPEATHQEPQLPFQFTRRKRSAIQHKPRAQAQLHQVMQSLFPQTLPPPFQQVHRKPRSVFERRPRTELQLQQIWTELFPRRQQQRLQELVEWEQDDVQKRGQTKMQRWLEQRRLQRLLWQQQQQGTCADGPQMQLEDTQQQQQQEQLPIVGDKSGAQRQQQEEQQVQLQQQQQLQQRRDNWLLQQQQREVYVGAHQNKAEAVHGMDLALALFGGYAEMLQPAGSYSAEAVAAMKRQLQDGSSAATIMQAYGLLPSNQQLHENGLDAEDVDVASKVAAASKPEDDEPLPVCQPNTQSAFALKFAVAAELEAVPEAAPTAAAESRTQYAAATGCQLDSTAAPNEVALLPKSDEAVAVPEAVVPPAKELQAAPEAELTLQAGPEAELTGLKAQVELPLARVLEAEAERDTAAELDSELVAEAELQMAPNTSSEFQSVVESGPATGVAMQQHISFEPKAICEPALVWAADHDDQIQLMVEAAPASVSAVCEVQAQQLEPWRAPGADEENESEHAFAQQHAPQQQQRPRRQQHHYELPAIEQELRYICHRPGRSHPWQVQLKAQKQNVWVGSYSTQAEAMRVRDIALLALHSVGNCKTEVAPCCYAATEIAAMREQLAKKPHACEAMQAQGLWPLNGQQLAAEQQQLRSALPDSSVLQHVALQQRQEEEEEQQQQQQQEQPPQLREAQLQLQEDQQPLQQAQLQFQEDQQPLQQAQLQLQEDQQPLQQAQLQLQEDQPQSHHAQLQQPQDQQQSPRQENLSQLQQDQPQWQHAQQQLQDGQLQLQEDQQQRQQENQPQLQQDQPQQLHDNVLQRVLQQQNLPQLQWDQPRLQQDQQQLQQDQLLSQQNQPQQHENLSQPQKDQQQLLPQQAHQQKQDLQQHKQQMLVEVQPDKQHDRHPLTHYTERQSDQRKHIKCSSETTQPHKPQLIADKQQQAEGDMVSEQHLLMQQQHLSDQAGQVPLEAEAEQLSGRDQPAAQQPNSGAQSAPDTAAGDDAAAAAAAGVRQEPAEAAPGATGAQAVQQLSAAQQTGEPPAEPLLQAVQQLGQQHAQLLAPPESITMGQAARPVNAEADSCSATALAAESAPCARTVACMPSTTEVSASSDAARAFSSDPAAPSGMAGAAARAAVTDTAALAVAAARTGTAVAGYCVPAASGAMAWAPQAAGASAPTATNPALAACWYGGGQSTLNWLPADTNQTAAGDAAAQYAPPWVSAPAADPTWLTAEQGVFATWIEQCCERQHADASAPAAEAAKATAAALNASRLPDAHGPAAAVGSDAAAADTTDATADDPAHLVAGPAAAQPKPGEKYCMHCRTTQTSLWRKLHPDAPPGNENNLCNKCAMWRRNNGCLPDLTQPYVQQCRTKPKGDRPPRPKPQRPRPEVDADLQQLLQQGRQLRQERRRPRWQVDSSDDEEDQARQPLRVKKRYNRYSVDDDSDDDFYRRDAELRYLQAVQQRRQRQREQTQRELREQQGLVGYESSTEEHSTSGSEREEEQPAKEAPTVRYEHIQLPKKDAQPGDYKRIELNRRWSHRQYEAAAAAGAKRLGVPVTCPRRRRQQQQQQRPRSASQQPHSSSIATAAIALVAAANGVAAVGPGQCVASGQSAPVAEVAAAALSTAALADAALADAFPGSDLLERAEAAELVGAALSWERAAAAADQSPGAAPGKAAANGLTADSATAEGCAAHSNAAATTTGTAECREAAARALQPAAVAGPGSGAAGAHAAQTTVAVKPATELSTETPPDAAVVGPVPVSQPIVSAAIATGEAVALLAAAPAARGAAEADCAAGTDPSVVQKSPSAAVAAVPSLAAAAAGFAGRRARAARSLPPAAATAEFGVLMLAHDKGVPQSAIWQEWEASHHGAVVVLVHLKAGVDLDGAGTSAVSGSEWLAAGRLLSTRIASQWGDASLTEAILAAAGEMLQKCPHLQHIAVVSGQDIPTASLPLPLPVGVSMFGCFQFGREYDAAARDLATLLLRAKLRMAPNVARMWGNALTFHHTWLIVSRHLVLALLSKQEEILSVGAVLNERFMQPDAAVAADEFLLCTAAMRYGFVRQIERRSIAAFARAEKHYKRQQQQALQEQHTLRRQQVVPHYSRKQQVQQQLVRYSSSRRLSPSPAAAQALPGLMGSSNHAEGAVGCRSSRHSSPCCSTSNVDAPPPKSGTPSADQLQESKREQAAAGEQTDVVELAAQQPSNTPPAEGAQQAVQQPGDSTLPAEGADQHLPQHQAEQQQPHQQAKQQQHQSQAEKQQLQDWGRQQSGDSAGMPAAQQVSMARSPGIRENSPAATIGPAATANDIYATVTDGTAAAVVSKSAAAGVMATAGATDTVNAATTSGESACCAAGVVPGASCSGTAAAAAAGNSGLPAGATGLPPRCHNRKSPGLAAAAPTGNGSTEQRPASGKSSAGLGSIGAGRGAARMKLSTSGKADMASLTAAAGKCDAEDLMGHGVLLDCCPTLALFHPTLTRHPHTWRNFTESLLCDVHTVDEHASNKLSLLQALGLARPNGALFFRKLDVARQAAQETLLQLLRLLWQDKYLPSNLTELEATQLAA